MTTSFAGGGAEFVARTWADWLASHGFDVRLATTTIHDNGEAPKGVRHIPLDGRNPARAIRSLRKVLLGEPTDVVLAIQSWPNLLALAACMGRRRPALIVSERNITSREGEPMRLPDRIKRMLALRFYRRADLAIAVSHSVAAELVSVYRVPGSRVVTVPNPAGQRAEARSSLVRPVPTGDEPVRLTLPMRLVPQKRVGLAVAAAAVLRERGIDARILCFGTQSGMTGLAADAESHGVPLEAPGWVPDWVAATPPGAVAVLPSYREGFGNVLVEAAYAGIPSVAVSNAFGVADALIPGFSGQLALVGTPEALADAVLAARDTPMHHVGDWTRRFSTDESGRLLTVALERAISNHLDGHRQKGPTA
ncbi:glycosyltransferase [Micromonospora sp. DT81.3]|uniref:glycosyltransferase n=1 Tax=Actinomycetes TaxID=1760 RepID=UPI003CF2B252